MMQSKNIIEIVSTHPIHRKCYFYSQGLCLTVVSHLLISRPVDLRAGISNTNSFVPCVRKKSTFAIWKGNTAPRRLKNEYVGVPGCLPIALELQIRISPFWSRKAQCRQFNSSLKVDPLWSHFQCRHWAFRDQNVRVGICNSRAIGSLPGTQTYSFFSILAAV